MEGQRASRRGSQQQHHHHGPHDHHQNAIADLEARLREAHLDRYGLGQELQRAQVVLRLLQSSLTGKIRARDELIHQLFDAAAGKGGTGAGAASIEELRARHAKLARQTAGMDHGVAVEEEKEATAAADVAAGVGEHQAALEELAATRRENQRLQELVASLQEQQQQEHTPYIPREEEEEGTPSQPSAPPSSSSNADSKGEVTALRRENAELRAQLAAQQRRLAELTAADPTLPARLRQVAASCAALSQDVAGARAAIREELATGVGDVIERAREGLWAFAAAQDGEVGQLRRLYQAEQAERRRLFNLVQELRGNIRVLVRPRPPAALEAGGLGVEDGEGNGGEGGEGEEVCMRLDPEAGEVSLAYGRKHKVFEFDHVYGTGATQAEVYEQVAPIVVSVLDGYNACVLAYGQTGSGKTHTMQGPPDDRGVNMLALTELFARVAARRAEGGEDAVSISILEIYNESIVDLLAGTAEEGTGGSRSRWEIKQGPQGMYVTDLTTVPVASLEEVVGLLAQGERCRAKAATNLNEHSSRSHLVLSVYVQSRDAASGVATRAKLHLIDLAGSERVRKSGAEGTALKEAQAINKSLSALGDVIHARLARATHVPFRNSTLTYLLQDSLSGDAKVLMLVCVSPTLANAEESGATLQFAARVRKVELGRAAKQVVAAAAAAPSLDGSAGSSGGYSSGGGGGSSGGSDPNPNPGVGPSPASAFADATASSKAAQQHQQHQHHQHQQQHQQPPPPQQKRNPPSVAGKGARRSNA